MNASYSKLTEYFQEISDLTAVLALLDWDQQTCMPAGGAQSRSQQMSTLAGILHARYTSDEVGRLLEDLAPYRSQLEEDSIEARLIKTAEREHRKRLRIPPEWVSDFARVTSTAQDNWQHARAENNFSVFEAILTEIVDLRRAYSSFFEPYDHVYDPQLDDYEPGMKTAEVKAIFDVLEPAQVDLVKELAEHPEVDDSFLQQPFDEVTQWDFATRVVTSYGFDWNRGRQDRSAHPFSTSVGVGDTRITTRVDPLRGINTLFSSMHECGHALYELGFDPGLARTPLAAGASMAIHESQSRLWENLVGRSLSFWSFNFPGLQAMFPAQLGNVDLISFYRAINRVKPSLIRVDSDEATYNLHIMLRFELEIALMEGTLEVKDLPEAWRNGMQKYLGITPPDFAQGVLQDIHWSAGLFGYFPTYALGNLISVQWWDCIQNAVPGLENQIACGDFSRLLEWLRENIHRHGARYEPQELVKKVTGESINPKPYLAYLERKYREIYR